MILSVPDPWTPPGGPVEITVPAKQIVGGFWASLWARDAEDNPSRALLAYLTASRALGGLEASWSDPAGFREARDYLNSHRLQKGSSS